MKVRIALIYILLASIELRAMKYITSSNEEVSAEDLNLTIVDALMEKGGAQELLEAQEILYHMLNSMDNETTSCAYKKLAILAKQKGRPHSMYALRGLLVNYTNLYKDISHCFELSEGNTTIDHNNFQHLRDVAYRLQYTKDTDVLAELIGYADSNSILPKCLAHIALGLAHYLNAEHKCYQNWFLEALRMLRDHGDDELRAAIFLGLGASGFRDHSHKKRSDWFLDVLSLPDNSKNILLYKAEALLALGMVARYEDDLDGESFLRQVIALKVHDKHIDLIKARAYNALGFILKQLPYFLEALKLLENEEITRLRILAYIHAKAATSIGLGNANYTDMHHLETAEWFIEALILLDGTQEIMLKERALRGLANFHRSKRNNKKAIEYYEQALALPLRDKFKAKLKSYIAQAKTFIFIDQQNALLNQTKL